MLTGFIQYKNVLICDKNKKNNTEIRRKKSGSIPV